MKKIFFCFLSLFIALTISAQSDKLIDVVYLKNGSILRGIIIEQIPNETIKLQTSDGNIFVYKTSEIEKITKEGVSNLNKKSGKRSDYNKTNEGFSTKYWHGTEAITKDEFISALRSNSAAYNEYNSGKTIKNIGGFIGIPSALVFGWQLGNLTAGDDLNTAATVIGGIGFAGGIIMMLVGENKINKSINILNDNDYDVSLKFNINPDGIGLAFHF